MKRRWFLAGLALSAVSAGCQDRAALTPDAADNNAGTALQTPDGQPLQVIRSSQTLVMATSANYPPYEQIDEAGTTALDSTLTASSSTEIAPITNAEGQLIVGFDIDVAKGIANYLGRQLTVVDLAFGSLIPALVNEEVDMAMAALAPNRRRKQQVDFSNIYYRSRHALVSYDGYLRSRDLNYQAIAVRAGSVQARYADRLSSELPRLDFVPYDTLRDVFEALDEGVVEAAIVEANVAETYLQRYSDFGAHLLPSDRATGSAIALPKSSALRRDINAALTDLTTSGEMNRLIVKWFS